MSSQGMGINEAKYYRLHITALISLICSLYLSGLPRHSLMANMASISQYKLTKEAKLQLYNSKKAIPSGIV